MTTESIDRGEIHAFAIRQEVEIAAPIETAFEALLDELGPEAQMPNGQSLAMKLEPWPGGRWYRDLGDNAGHFWGHVQVIKPPTLLEIAGPMPMSCPALNHIQYRLKANDGGTLLTFAHRAMGLLLPEHRAGMPDGWAHWLGRIRALAERRNRNGS